MRQAHRIGITARLSLAACIMAVMLMVCSAAFAAQSVYSNFATYDGHKVHYQNHGKGGDAVVLIHGWACDTEFWREQVPALVQGGYRVINLDLPGHGKSGRPKVVYTQIYFADALKAVLDHAGVKRAVLVGHSMGVNIARRFIRRYPGIALAIINVEGAVEYMPDDPKVRAKWLKEGQAFRSECAGPQGRASVAKFVNSMHVPGTPAELRRWIEKKMLGTHWPAAVSAMVNFVDPKIWSNEPVKLPALVIYADYKFLPPDNAATMGKLFPKMEYHKVAGVGHFLMLEKPRVINGLMLNFLPKVMPKGR